MVLEGGHGGSSTVAGGARPLVQGDCLCSHVTLGETAGLSLNLFLHV